MVSDVAAGVRPGLPYWRLSAFYFFYFAALGGLVPYWGLYLQAQGFGARQIGELMAVLMVTKLLAPNAWGWLADHLGRRMAIIRLASALAVLAFAGVFLGSGYWWVALVMATFSFFWNAALPQFEAVTLSQLGAQVHRYSRIRLWGSVGFILSVAALGVLLDHRGAGLLPGVLWGLFLGIWLASLWVPEAPYPSSHVPPVALKSVLRRPEVIALLLVCLLMQAGHGPYYTFFSIYLQDAGYSRSGIGLLWALGVLAEVGVFAVMHRWLPSIGPRRLLVASLGLAALRWLLIAAFPQHLGIMLVAQTLHAASFGVYHAVSIHLIHERFPGRLQGRGQALYSSLSFGAGGALGSLGSGHLWATLGGAATFAVAAGVSLLAMLIAALWIEPRTGPRV